MIYVNNFRLCHESWKNCVFRTHQMNFMVSNIFRDENTCANKLWNLEISLIIGLDIFLVLIK
jgi:hypothetical protein